MNDRAQGQKVLEIRFPFTGEVVGTVPKATVADVRKAFEEARAYKPTLTRYERATILQKAAALLRERVAQASDLITRESGLSNEVIRNFAGRVPTLGVCLGHQCIGHTFGGEVVVNRQPKRLVAAPATRAEELEKNLTETHEPSKHAAHEDLYVAIRDAFNAAARKLQDYAQRQRGTVKSHIFEPPSYPTAAQSENR